MKLHIDWSTGNVLVTDAVRNTNIRIENARATVQNAILKAAREAGYKDASVWDDSKNITEFLKRTKTRSSPNFEKPFGEFVFVIRAKAIKNKPLSAWPTAEEIEARNAVYQEKSEQEQGREGN